MKYAAVATAGVVIGYVAAATFIAASAILDTPQWQSAMVTVERARTEHRNAQIRRAFRGGKVPRAAKWQS